MKKTFLKVVALTLVLVFAFSPSVMASNTVSATYSQNCCIGCVSNVEFGVPLMHIGGVNNEIAPRGCGHHIWNVIDIDIISSGSWSNCLAVTGCSVRVVQYRQVLRCIFCGAGTFIVRTGVQHTICAWTF